MKQCSYFRTPLMWLLVLCTAAGQDWQAPRTTSLPGAATISEVKGRLHLYGPHGALLSPQRGQILDPGSTIETEKGSVLL